MDTMIGKRACGDEVGRHMQRNGSHFKEIKKKLLGKGKIDHKSPCTSYVCMLLFLCICIDGNLYRCICTMIINAYFLYTYLRNKYISIYVFNI